MCFIEDTAGESTGSVSQVTAMDGDFARFADSLVPSAEYLSYGNAAMDKLFRTLQVIWHFNQKCVLTLALVMVVKTT